MANKTKVTPPDAKNEAQEKQPLETPDTLLPLPDSATPITAAR